MNMSIDALKTDLTIPEVTAQDLLGQCRPAIRFSDVSFDNFTPNPQFQSQFKVRLALKTFVETYPKPLPLWFLSAFRPRPGVGYYLDGGFGVGKTHLLAAVWYAFRESKAFLSFSELVYWIGMLGLVQATALFKPYRLLCIDEFELDDPGNTHLICTFLDALMSRGLHVVTTSNTQPEQLGQGRFNAQDFRQQISSISSKFEVLTLDGPDYRQQQGVPLSLSVQEVDRLEARQNNRYSRISAPDLHHYLSRIHPARLGVALSSVKAIFVDGLEAISDQNRALRYVHFIDKVYDLNLLYGCSGVEAGQLFDESYLRGAFQKKYSRCISRSRKLALEARNQVEFPVVLD